jgi:hypothetical protein
MIMPGQLQLAGRHSRFDTFRLGRQDAPHCGCGRILKTLYEDVVSQPSSQERGF